MRGNVETGTRRLGMIRLGTVMMTLAAAVTLALPSAAPAKGHHKHHKKKGGLHLTHQKPKQVIKFWTPARLASAQPLPAAPEPDQAPPTVKSGSVSPRIADSMTPEEFSDTKLLGSATLPTGRLDPSVAVHGAVFFIAGPGSGELFRCAGTSVNSNGRSAVMTAASCVYDFNRDTYVRDWMFIPAFQGDGSVPGPLGEWPANWLYASGAFRACGCAAADVGGAIVDRIQVGQSKNYVALGNLVGESIFTPNLVTPDNITASTISIYGYPDTTLYGPAGGPQQFPGDATYPQQKGLRTSQVLHGYYPGYCYAEGGSPVVVDFIHGSPVAPCNVTGDGMRGGGWMVGPGAGDLISNTTGYDGYDYWHYVDSNMIGDNREDAYCQKNDGYSCVFTNYHRIVGVDYDYPIRDGVWSRLQASPKQLYSLQLPAPAVERIATLGPGLNNHPFVCEVCK